MRLCEIIKSVSVGKEKDWDTAMLRGQRMRKAQQRGLGKKGQGVRKETKRVRYLKTKRRKYFREEE